MFTPNRKHTVEHLKDLRDEVRELHPILNVLFRKMPGIQRVHYNQGSHEMGADFILFRQDEALCRTTYIGIVAKVGVIRQDTTEVDRQIKECFIPRRVSDGTPIQIREVWVVSSSEITQNARDVINKQYVDRKVEFIAGQDLASLIDRFAPDAFITTSPALQAFAENTIAALNAEDRRSLVVPGMESFYIQPDIVRMDFDGYGSSRTRRKVSSFEDLIRALLSSQLSVIEANAGGGKSRLARELSKHVLESQHFSDGKLLPVIGHAKDYTEDTHRSLSESLVRVRAAAQSDAKAIIFVDGFDEIDLSDSARGIVIDGLVKAAASEGASVVLLSRPFNEASVLGGRLQSLEVFKIQPLKGKKAIELLEKIAGNLDVRSRLVADLGKSDLLRALEGSPIAYILLGRLIAENRHELPSNLTELFQKYTELVLGRWEMSKGLRSQQEYEVIVESLKWLSAYLLENKLSEVARSELEKWIVAYCRERGIKISCERIVDRMADRNSVLYLRSDVKTIGFRHRALSEFYYAKVLIERPKIELTSEVFSPYWKDSYFFLVGLKRDCPEILTTLTNLELREESEKIIRALTFGDLLLAGYLTPTRVAKSAMVKVVTELASIYVEACDPKSKSPLTQFPTIQLLCALATTFRYQYGYYFFQLALGEAIYDLEGAPASEQTAVALFLLDTAYRESGGDLRFDQLLERFGDSLPLVLKLAISHESDRMKIVSDRVRKMERNVRRTLRAHKGSKIFLKQIYDVPIRALSKKIG